MADPIHIDLPGEFRLTVASETEQGAEVGCITASDSSGECNVIPLPLMLDADKMRELGWALLCASAFDPFGCCYEEGERPSPMPVQGRDDFGRRAHRDETGQVVLDFGAFAGKPLTDADDGYLKWMIEKVDLPADLKAAAADEIRRRV